MFVRINRATFVCTGYVNAALFIFNYQFIQDFVILFYSTVQMMPIQLF